MIPVPVLPETAGEALVFEEDAEEVEETIADHAAIVGNAQGAESAEVKIRGITEAVSLTGSGGNTRGEVQTERLPEHQRRGVVSCLASIWISGSIFCAGYVILINGSLKRRIGQMERLPDKKTGSGLYSKRGGISLPVRGLSSLYSAFKADGRELGAVRFGASARRDPLQAERPYLDGASDSAVYPVLVESACVAGSGPSPGGCGICL